MNKAQDIFNKAQLIFNKVVQKKDQNKLTEKKGLSPEAKSFGTGPSLLGTKAPKNKAPKYTVSPNERKGLDHSRAQEKLLQTWQEGAEDGMRVLRSPEQKEKDKTKARNFIAKMNADPNFDVNTKHGPELKIRRSNETAPSIPEEKQTQAWVNEADRKYKKALHRKELSKTYAMPPSDKKSDDLQKWNDSDIKGYKLERFFANDALKDQAKKQGPS